ncbi:DUF6193 family natural product biosynthesis protein [Kitasatospora paracochleata]|uniref:Uncharacterized protein n=1 Tax=Kitasatospora paracochleata TaxID=58354 RepID=A0ABT1IRL9_9ACTN|nr:DUF6193 family natural product biosynthesis protein [Kitasatospora paracochleata]MCP2307778.1 hypothetical protein [Kitasatospora paracochleata]
MSSGDPSVQASDGDASAEETWDFMRGMAARWDEQSRASTTTWLPPIMSALVEAAAANATLRRLHPFTSHRQLWFSTGPQPWKGEGDSFPTRIDPLESGRYRVERWAANQGPSETVLETASAEAAVAAAARIVEETLGRGGPSRTRP